MFVLINIIMRCENNLKNAQKEASDKKAEKNGREFKGKSLVEPTYRDLILERWPELCARYRNNIEAASLDLETMKEESNECEGDDTKKELMFQLEKRIREWKELLEEAKETLARNIENQKEMEKVKSDMKFEISKRLLKNFFGEVFGSAVKLGLVTAAGLGLLKYLGTITPTGEDILLGSSLVAGTFAVIKGILYLTSDQTLIFFKNLTEAVEKDINDIKNAVLKKEFNGKKE